MSLSGKWIDGIRPDGSVCDAARVSLATRLAAVGYWLPLAAQHADQDIEHVHRLRVSTRRAIAALKLYREWLPAKPYRWLKKRLKKVRRAAGDARDLDVLTDRIMRQRGASSQALLDEIGKRREAAQPVIVAIAERCRRKERFARQTCRLLERIKPSAVACETGSSLKFRAWAQKQLVAQAEPFFSTMPDNQADTAALHQFRIRAKALRYTIELVAPAFDSKLRTDHYPLVEELQERLGRINDAASASLHIREWSEEVADVERQEELRGFADQEAARLEERLREFREWWTVERAETLKNALAITSAPATLQ